MVDIVKRRRKSFRIYAHRKVVGMEIYITPEMGERLNDAWLASNSPFFSRWVTEQLEAVLDAKDSRGPLHMALDRTDGEWIITDRSDGKLELKLYGDSQGRRAAYEIKGSLK